MQDVFGYMTKAPTVQSNTKQRSVFSRSALHWKQHKKKATIVSIQLIWVHKVCRAVQLLPIVRLVSDQSTSNNPNCKKKTASGSHSSHFKSSLKHKPISNLWSKDFLDLKLQYLQKYFPLKRGIASKHLLYKYRNTIQGTKDVETFVIWATSTSIAGFNTTLKAHRNQSIQKSSEPNCSFSAKVWDGVEIHLS